MQRPREVSGDHSAVFWILVSMEYKTRSSARVPSNVGSRAVVVQKTVMMVEVTTVVLEYGGGS